MSNVSTRAGGVFSPRALLGIIFMMQGYGKVFKYNVPKVYDLFFKILKQPFYANGSFGSPPGILLILNCSAGSCLSPASPGKSRCTCWALTS